MKVSYTLICMRQDGILILLCIFALHQFIPSLVFKHQLAEWSEQVDPTKQQWRVHHARYTKFSTSSWSTP